MEEEKQESSSDEEVKEDTQKEKKLSSKELKRKREKALKLEQEKLGKLKQAQGLIEQDMERKAAMEQSVKVKTINGVLGDKKEKIGEKAEKLKSLEKKKKKKLQNGAVLSNDNETVKELLKLAEDLEKKSDVTIKKKKKKKDKKKDIVVDKIDMSITQFEEKNELVQTESVEDQSLIDKDMELPTDP